MARRLNIETIGVKNTPVLDSSCDVVLRVKNRTPEQGIFVNWSFVKIYPVLVAKLIF